MRRDVFKFVITMLLGYFVGYVVIYNIIIRGRDLSQIPWRPHYLLIYLIIGISGIISRFKRKR